MSKSRLKHPKALAPLTLCYALFMAAFGGILASLTLYQTNQLHMDTDTAYGVFAAAMALLWILPLLGGYLAGKWGYIPAARMGVIACTLGMAAFCFNSVATLYIGLALFVVGNALATPAIWCMVDHCYTKNSPLREAGFTLFYLFFNLGAVISIFAGGALAEKFGFGVEFGLDTACLILAYLLLQFYSHHISSHKDRSIAAQVSWSRKKIYTALSLSILIGTPVSIILFNHLNLNNILMMTLMLASVALLLIKALNRSDKQQRNRMLAFIFLSIISVIFWILYSLEPSFLSVFINTNVDTTLLGANLPASSFFAFDGVFVILIGLILSRLWFYLSIKNKNPSLAVKFSSSLVIIGLGFVYLAWMVTFHKSTLMPAHDIVIAYAIFATAELLVSPLGISMVGSLAPEGEEGLMMGFWQLSTGVGGVLAGYIAILPNLPQTTAPLIVSNLIYYKTFLWVGLGALIAGLIILCFARKLAHLMRETAYLAPQV
ncbi:MAG: oligopeptide:H+ symporter [Gammaproteobacteria bacterium]|nr:oligopeptide:H+ symporter [Gammaproteobacteria bacterium]